LGGSPIEAVEALVRANTDLLVTKLKEQRDNKAIININEWYSWVILDLVGDWVWVESFDCVKSSKSHSWLALSQVAILGTFRAMMGRYTLLKQAAMKFAPRRLIELPQTVVREKNSRLSGNKATIESFAVSVNGQGGLSDVEQVANIAAFVLVVSNTSAPTLSAATYFLARNPVCARKEREEIRSTSRARTTSLVGLFQHYPT
jgi:hypothetical protein